jgi:LacI family transcriptional regulator
VTLKQIAKEVDVSIDTVSRVLAGKVKEQSPRIAARAARVREVAERLNYRPNEVARAVRSGRFGNVALLQSPLRNRSLLSNLLLDGIQRASARGKLVTSAPK